MSDHMGKFRLDKIDIDDFFDEVSKSPLSIDEIIKKFTETDARATDSQAEFASSQESNAESTAKSESSDSTAKAEETGKDSEKPSDLRAEVKFHFTTNSASSKPESSDSTAKVEETRKDSEKPSDLRAEVKFHFTTNSASPKSESSDSTAKAEETGKDSENPSDLRAEVKVHFTTNSASSKTAKASDKTHASPAPPKTPNIPKRDGEPIDYPFSNVHPIQRKPGETSNASSQRNNGARTPLNDENVEFAPQKGTYLVGFAIRLVIAYLILITIGAFVEKFPPTVARVMWIAFALFVILPFPSFAPKGKAKKS